jgi:putative transposase
MERVLRYIKGGFARRIGEELNLKFLIWQRGFSDHRIRNVDEYAVYVWYIKENPVKRRLAAISQAYPWSSASGRFQLDESP